MISLGGGRELIAVFAILVFAVGKTALFANKWILIRSICSANLKANLHTSCDLTFFIVRQWLWEMVPNLRQQVAARILTRSLSVSLILLKRYIANAAPIVNILFIQSMAIPKDFQASQGHSICISCTASVIISKV
jgi:hypothetical protein